MHPTAISLKRQWRVPVLAALAAVLFAVAFAASATLSRMGSSPGAVTSPKADLATGGVSTTDREIGGLQEHLRQQPSDWGSATQLGLAYLQRARDTSDPSYLPPAAGILTHAPAHPPTDTQPP